MSFTKPRYDADAYKADLKQSVAPMQYQMYQGASVNENRCQVVPPTQHFSQVDIESDMKGLNRFHPKSGEKMYSADGKSTMQAGSSSAISTFDPRAHININPAVCPDVTRHLLRNSGIERPVGPGYTMPSGQLSCPSK